MVITRINSYCRHLMMLITVCFFTLLPRLTFASDVEWHELINTDAVSGRITTFSKTFGVFINGVMGMGVMTGVLVFIVLAVKLASYSNMPAIRTVIIRKMLVAGICIAGLGGTMIIYNMIIAIAVG